MLVFPVENQDDGMLRFEMAQLEARSEEYLRQRNYLVLLSHMALMLLEMQTHRGASMAMLSGGNEFIFTVIGAKRRVISCIHFIDNFSVQIGDEKKGDSWSQIKSEWKALNQQLQSDDCVSNFEFHSHLIDGLINMMMEVSKKVGETRLFEAKSSSFHEGRARHLLLHICLKLMPCLVENIAKLRGLSTYLCVTGQADERVVSRLASLQQKINKNKEDLRQACKALPQASFSEVPALGAILLHEHKLGQLQRLVQSKVMDVARMELDGGRLFSMATETIEAYYQVMVDGLACFQQDLQRCWLAK